MEGKKILMMFLLGLFWISFVSSSNCDPIINVKFGIYDKILGEGGAYFERSLFQPMGFGEIVKEGNYFLVESFNFQINNTCPVEERVIISMKPPGEENFTNLYYIPLEYALNENGLIKYSFKLINLNIHSLEAYKDNRGEFINFLWGERLDVIGKWSFSNLYGGEVFVNLVNERYFLSDGFEVRDRLEVQKLEEAEEEAMRNSLRFWFSTFLVLFVLSTSVYFMNKTSNDQIKKMEEHYEKQTKKEDKREEEKQFSLLESLHSELVALESNLNSYKRDVVPNPLWFTTQDIREISSSLYIGGLSRKIKKIKTKFLKQDIIKINQKMDIINSQMMLLASGRIPNLEKSRKNILTIINEVLPLIRKSKKFIEGNFKIK